MRRVDRAGVCLLAMLCLVLTAGGVAAQEPQEAETVAQEAPKESPAAPDYSENHFALSLYGGYLTTQVFSELYTGPNRLVNTTLFALSLSRELFSVGHVLGVSALEPLKIEAEGIAVVHSGVWPENQSFSEFAGSLNLRWHRFPWNRHVLTTMGFGEGLSYASQKPSYEIEINNKTANLLNYLMFDVTFAHPDLPELALLFRLHHRSGVFGLFDDVSGGSNFFVAGLKFRF